ncbi:MAG: hypothetical protein ACOC91_02020 [bacterium]
MTVRAKLCLTEIVEHAGTGAKTLKFQAQYDDSIPEDRRFSQATPSGHVELYVDNPSALERFRLGESYYVDFTPAAE